MRKYWIVTRRGKFGTSPTIVPHLYRTKKVATFWATLANDDGAVPYGDYVPVRVEIKVAS